MTEQLPNAPVALVVLDARLVIEDETWSPEGLSQLLTELRSDGAAVADEEPDKRGLPRARFTFEGEGMHGHVMADRLLVRQRSPYPSWETLGPRLSKILQSFWRSGPEECRVAASLEYQNHVHLGRATLVEPSDYFNIFPGTSGPLDRSYVAFMSGIVTIAEDGQSLIRVEVVSSSDDEEPDSVFADLHISFTSAEDAGLEKFEASGWLDMAHAEVEETFFASITDRARDRMEERAQ